MFFRKSHSKAVEKLGDTLYDVEHFRVWSDGKHLPHLHPGEPARVVKHVACVILKNGHVFMGEAVCNPKDSYNHKLGYEIAVGRALSEAVDSRAGDMPISMMADPLLKGRELRDACREALEALGEL